MKDRKMYEEIVWDIEEFLEELNEDDNCKNVTYTKIGDGSYLVKWEEI